MSDLRNALARARDEWLDGDVGQHAASGSPTGQYLRNRLEAAFCAGWNAAEKNAEKAAAVLPINAAAEARIEKLLSEKRAKPSEPCATCGSIGGHVGYCPDCAKRVRR